MALGMSRRVLLLAKPNGQNISLLLVTKNKDSIPKKNNVLSKYDWMQKLNMEGGISPDFDAHHQGNLYDSHYTSNYILTYCIDKSATTVHLTSQRWKRTLWSTPQQLNQ
jgi:hypothetical protein